MTIHTFNHLEVVAPRDANGNLNPKLKYAVAYILHGDAATGLVVLYQIARKARFVRWPPRGAELKIMSERDVMHIARRHSPKYGLPSKLLSLVQDKNL